MSFGKRFKNVTALVKGAALRPPFMTVQMQYYSNLVFQQLVERQEIMAARVREVAESC